MDLLAETTMKSGAKSDKDDELHSQRIIRSRTQMAAVASVAAIAG